MRENRQSGSEGGARFNPLSLPPSGAGGGRELREGARTLGRFSVRGSRGSRIGRARWGGRMLKRRERRGPGGWGAGSFGKERGL